MVRQRLLAMVTVFLLVVSYAWPSSVAFSSSNNNTSIEYVGPGKHETELYIRNQASKQRKDELIKAGTVSMWNTREEFIVSVETAENWQITEVRMFVGTDTIPLSTGGTPQIG